MLLLYINPKKHHNHKLIIFSTCHQGYGLSPLSELKMRYCLDRKSSMRCISPYINHNFICFAFNINLTGGKWGFSCKTPKNIIVTSPNPPIYLFRVGCNFYTVPGDILHCVTLSLHF